MQLVSLMDGWIGPDNSTGGIVLAYLDQGAGSYVLQTVTAGFFGLVYLAKQALGAAARLVSRRDKHG
jgi:hypothetical protein